MRQRQREKVSKTGTWYGIDRIFRGKLPRRRCLLGFLFFFLLWLKFSCIREMLGLGGDAIVKLKKRERV